MAGDLAAIFERLFPVAPEPGADLDPAALARAEKLFRPLSAYFRTEFAGLENLPPGGALLATNHGPLGFDSVELVFGLYRKTGRLARGLAEKNFFRVPALKTVLERLGHVAGTAENALRLLGRGELVLVYPGGAREVFKGAKERYALAWEKSKGFVRLALRARAPVVPVAGIGVDEYYDVVKEPEAVAETVLGKALRALLGGGMKYVPPEWRGIGPLPKPVRLTFVVGKPIAFEEPPEAAEDAAVVDALQARVKETLERMIMVGRIRRG
jgi:1-acyl-sn-glycerol-3-phosphate acyltransferase